MILLHQYLWISSGALCAAALLIGLWNKRWTTFPAFFALLGYYVVEVAVGYWIGTCVKSDAVWRWYVLLSSEVGFCIDLMVLYQLVTVLIFPHGALAKLARTLLERTLAVLVLVSTFLTALTPGVSHFAVTRTLEKLEFAEGFAELGLMLALVLFSRALGISWKSLPEGVALGWGIASATDIFSEILLTRLGGTFYWSADTIHMAGFQVCLLVWLWYILRPETTRVEETPGEELAGLASQADVWSGMRQE